MHIGSPTIFGIENDADDEDDDIDNINECDDDQLVLYYIIFYNIFVL